MQDRTPQGRILLEHPAMELMERHLRTTRARTLFTSRRRQNMPLVAVFEVRDAWDLARRDTFTGRL
jgi:hypothetical protein